MMRAFPVALPFWLIVTALSGTACLPTTQPDTGTETRTSNLDFETGRLEGTVTWNGLPIGETVVVRTATWSVFTDASGHFVAETAPGSYDIFLVSRLCEDKTITQRTAVVTAGLTTTLDIDVTQDMGHVVGSIAFNGVPTPSVGFVAITPRCGALFPDDTGSFSTFLPVSSDYGAIIASGSGLLETVSFVVDPGSTVVLDRNYLVGTVQGGITWNGAPIAPPDNFNVGAETWSASSGGPNGRYANQYVPPGDYTLTLTTRECLTPLDTKDITVAAGAITNADFDLTSVAGRIVASFTIDGVPASDLTFRLPCGGAILVGNSGRLSRVLPPGSYDVTIRRGLTSGPPVGELSFTITPGQTTDLGVVNFDDPAAALGTVVGTVFWNGAPIAEPTFVGLQVDSTVQQTDGAGRYSWALPPGTHTVVAWSRECGPVYAEVPVTLTAGATTTADFDITASAGRVTGLITVNGAPLQFPIVRVCGTPVYGGRDGRFSQLLPPGLYDGEVAPFGTFSFAVVAGQTTDIDVLTTEVGTNVPVNPGSGVSLVFDEVTQAGNTVVVVSGEGPPPPTGYEIYPFGAPRHWDIDTTATYAGQILVCITFDPDLIVGDPSALTLRHYKNSTTVWENITMGPPVGNQICGLTDSLSPFAIMMPIAVADTDPPVWGDVPDPVRAFGTSTAGAIVNYTVPSAIDAVDGPVAVSCTPASGSQFPVNRTPVTCTAVDASGNATTTSFTVWVTYEAPTDGTFFIRPIRADGSSRFKIGRAVPVKFRLAGASAAITDLRATLVVTKLSGAVRGTNDDECDEDGEDADFTFRYRPAKNLYGYRWKTRGETQGTYRLSANLGDGVVHEVNVSLKVPR